MPVSLQAAFWGLLSGSALIVGAAVAWFVRLEQRLIAGIMAFGAGVLISALSFELMNQAWKRGGFAPAAGGFLGGAIVYSVLNFIVSQHGAKHRKRSNAGARNKDKEKNPANGMALAIGALLDGIPESIVIGVSLLQGGAVGMVAVIAVFLSNIPEGLSSAAGMKKEGRSASFVFLLWTAVTAVSGLAAWLGYVALAGTGPGMIAAVQAIAAGAMLAMIVDTMVPEAFEGTHDYAGLITVVGFLCAFALSKLD